jgi:hypothetical protein
MFLSSIVVVCTIPFLNSSPGLPLPLANKFRNEELNELRELIVRVADEFNEYKFRLFKKLLEDQLLVFEP